MENTKFYLFSEGECRRDVKVVMRTAGNMLGGWRVLYSRQKKMPPGWKNCWEGYRRSRRHPPELAGYQLQQWWQGESIQGGTEQAEKDALPHPLPRKTSGQSSVWAAAPKGSPPESWTSEWTTTHHSTEILPPSRSRTRPPHKIGRPGRASHPATTGALLPKRRATRPNIHQHDLLTLLSQHLRSGSSGPALPALRYVTSSTLQQCRSREEPVERVGAKKTEAKPASGTRKSHKS